MITLHDQTIEVCGAPMRVTATLCLWQGDPCVTLRAERSQVGSVSDIARALGPLGFRGYDATWTQTIRAPTAREAVRQAAPILAAALARLYDAAAAYAQRYSPGGSADARVIWYDTWADYLGGD